jgi:methionine-rich copper-binding protein CopC
MSIPKKPTGPITPKGPIKPVARPASKGISAAKPVANPGAAKAVSTAKPAAVKPSPVASAKTDTDKKTTSAPVKPNLETKDKKPATKPLAETKSSDNKVEASPSKKKFGFMDALFIFVLVALVGTNIFVHHVGQEKNKELQVELDSANEDIERLEVDVKQAEGNLERTQEQLTSLAEKSGLMENELTEKNNLLSVQKKKLGSLYATINNLKYNDNFDKALIDSLTSVVDGMNEQLLQLSKSNEIKALEIQTLKSQIAEGAGSKVEELMASELSITALLEKKGNTEETEKAKKVSKMELMFYIDEDEEIKAGLKTLFFRIVDPNGNTVGTAGNVTLTSTGSSVDYSLQGYVDYPLEGLESKMWIKPANAKMKKGKYKLEIYNSDMQIGTKTFELN